MIGPNAEALEGGGAISGDADRVRERLERALDRWKKVRREKKYTNRPVPTVRTAPPPEMAERPLLLRVFLRDLPRGREDESGRRFAKGDVRGPWLDFTEWAWNVNWFGVDSPDALVTTSKALVPVDEGLVDRLCRSILVDNVRGQTPPWAPEHLVSADLKMQRTALRGAKATIEYHGSATLESERQSYHPKLYGRAVWDSRAERFDSFELLAIGPRQGQGSFNQRARDLGPAPMGILLTLADLPSSD